MKKIIFNLAVIFTCSLASAQKMSSRDSINTFYKQLFSNLEKGYLYRSTTDWKTIRTDTENKLSSHHSFTSSLSEIQPLFDRIGAHHCSVYYKDRKYAATGKPVQQLLNESWKTTYASQPSLEVRVLDGDIGYIMIPKIVFQDLSAKNVHRISQPLYDQISQVKSQKNLKGWIIDLRLNTGGNAYSMILALYDFLGDNTVWGTIDKDHKTLSTVRLDHGVYYDNGKKVSHINPVPPLLDQIKTVILIGPATASSGEVAALAFKSRANTLFIGEETYGATTSNIQAELPFKSFMALTTGIDTDRNGKVYPTIIPDVTVVLQDNFQDLMKDGKVEKALEYLRR